MYYEQMRQRIMQAKRYNSEAQIEPWDEETELILFVPLLWASLLHWSAAEQYKFLHVDTKFMRALRTHANSVTRLLQSVSDSALRGHLTVEGTKKVIAVSTGDAEMAAAWEAIGSPLRDAKFASSLEEEISNAFSELTAIEKVSLVVIVVRFHLFISF
jgi:hypothetical protein